MKKSDTVARQPDTLRIRQSALWGIAIVIIIGYLLLGIHYQQTFSEMERLTLSTIMNNAGQAGYNISNILTNVDEISMFFLRNTNVYKILNRYQGDNSLNQQLDDFKDLKTLTEIIYEGKNVYAFRIFLNGENIYSREGISFFDIDDIAKTNLGKFLESHPDLVRQNGWTDSYHEKYLDKQDADVVSFIRFLHDESDYSKIIAIISIDVLKERLSNILSSISLDGGIVQIISASKQVIAASPEQKSNDVIRISEQNWHILTSTKRGILENTYEKEDWYFVYDRIPESDWSIVISIPKPAIRQGNTINSMTIGLILIFSVVILVVCMILVVFSHVTNNIIKKIQEIALQVQKGRIGFPIGSRSKDTYLRQIENYIEDITSNVSALEKQNYVANIKERDYHLKALQAQINPHFLYNTLDTINWMAIKHKAPEISNLTTSLAKYFRLSLNKGKDLVSLADEINLVSTYMDIQQVRFSNPVEWECKVDENLLACKLPKLTIQPIVENALIHGIRNCATGTGKILLQARTDGKDIVIEIQDNGIGMTKSEADSIMQGSENQKGYGLHNVLERIQLLYGSSYGITIESTLGKGTSVIIRIPNCESNPSGLVV